jgi:protein transport protein SEC61 subunit alpha
MASVLHAVGALACRHPAATVAGKRIAAPRGVSGLCQTRRLQFKLLQGWGERKRRRFDLQEVCCRATVAGGGGGVYGRDGLGVFDPLGLGDAAVFNLWEEALQGSDNIMQASGSGRSSSGRLSNTSSSAKSAAATMEDSSVDFGDFFKGKLPQKFLFLLGWLVLSRVGTYIPLWGVDRSAFAGSLDQSSLLGTLDTFSGGSIGRLGVSSLGIVPYINAQIVVQLLGSVFPKLQELQKKEGEAGRKKVKRWTQYASVGFGIIQAVGQVTYIRPYVNDFSIEWVGSAVAALTLGSVLTMLIGEKISDLKLGNGTSLLIFTNIVSYLPASIGRTIAQAISEGNYPGLAGSIAGFLLLVLGIVYVQEAERKIPINYASRYSFQSKGLGKAAYLPFKVGGYFFTFSYVLSELVEKLKTLSSFLCVCNQVQNSLGWRCRLTAQV